MGLPRRISSLFIDRGLRSARRLADHHHGGAQQTAVQQVTLLEHVQHAVRLHFGVFLHGHGLVVLRVERLAVRVDRFEVVALEGVLEHLQGQLDAFADGSRVNAVMMPIAQALSVTDRAALSTYYAALPVPTSPATAVPAVAASDPAGLHKPAGVGATLAISGRWADKLPACAQCHGPGGRGVGPDFPALTGQGALYLSNQLMAWKAGTRPPGPMGLMAVVAKKLSDAEVRAVADYFASLPTGASK